MMNILDTVLLNKFQHFSDLIQYWIGIDNFQISKILRFLVIVFFLFQVLFSFLKGIRPDDLIYICPVPFVIYFLSVLFDNGKESWETNKNFQNPLVIQWSIFRYVFLFLLIFPLITLPVVVYKLVCFIGNEKEYYINLESLVHCLKDICLVLFLYFASCTPKPHKPSKVEKMTRKIVGIIKSKTSSVPAFSVVR